MRKLGDKIASKLLAEEAGLPVAPWSGGPLLSVDDARRHGDAIGYPVVIKATAGGGGRGIRAVSSAADLPAAYESAAAEALKSFGDATLFMEKRLVDARHIEVQVIADEHGTAWAVGVRDCTIQRRNQKVIEESRSTVLTEEQERELLACDAKGARPARDERQDEDQRGAGRADFSQPQRREPGAERGLRHRAV